VIWSEFVEPLAPFLSHFWAWLILGPTSVVPLWVHLEDFLSQFAPWKPAWCAGWPECGGLLQAFSSEASQTKAAGSSRQALISFRRAPLKVSACLCQILRQLPSQFSRGTDLSGAFDSTTRNSQSLAFRFFTGAKLVPFKSWFPFSWSRLRDSIAQALMISSASVAIGLRRSSEEELTPEEPWDCVALIYSRTTYWFRV